MRASAATGAPTFFFVAPDVRLGEDQPFGATGHARRCRRTQDAPRTERQVSSGPEGQDVCLECLRDPRACRPSLARRSVRLRRTEPWSDSVERRLVFAEPLGAHGADDLHGDVPAIVPRRVRAPAALTPVRRRAAVVAEEEVRCLKHGLTLCACRSARPLRPSSSTPTIGAESVHDREP